jgi:hypothetical protein
MPAPVARDSPSLEDAYRCSRQALPADHRGTYDAVVGFLLQWLRQDEGEMAEIYVWRLLRLQRHGPTWPDAARQQHREN